MVTTVVGSDDGLVVMPCLPGIHVAVLFSYSVYQYSHSVSLGSDARSG
jgi:hypothetical protein